MLREEMHEEIRSRARDRDEEDWVRRPLERHGDFCTNRSNVLEVACSREVGKLPSILFDRMLGPMLQSPAMRNLSQRIFLGCDFQ